MRAEEKMMKEEAKGEGCTGKYFVEKVKRCLEERVEVTAIMA